MVGLRDRWHYNKSTYEKLQKYPGNENNCGRPGINGGYDKNPNAKFGVNCYAKKGNPSDKKTDDETDSNSSFTANE